MSSSTNNNDAKKRRANDDMGARSVPAATSIGCGQERDDDKLMSALHQLLDQNSKQMALMKNMQVELASMKGEITQLREKCDGMENLMLSRFDGVDNKQKYQEVLLQNQKWEYSAHRPSEYYWDSIGEWEDQAAEEFLDQIKTLTEEMRYGNGNGEIYLDVSLPYNVEFIPHWREFAHALEQHQYYLKCLPDDDNKSMLRLCDIELPDPVTDILSNALEATHFQMLLLENNNFGRGGIDFALKYLQKNQIIKDFSLVGNPIENMEQIRQLCQVVEGHPSIENSYLGGCRGEGLDGYEVLQMIMSAGKYKLKAIDLSGNGISTGGDTFISDFLANNPILECLDLSVNLLDDNDAMAIANALKHNTNLRTLNVLGNDAITKIGWTALQKAEFDDTSLSAAADSNHTCRMDYPHHLQGLRTSAVNGYATIDPTNAKQKKIYSILSSRNKEHSNVEHFDDVPVELLPDMLVSIQKYANYHVPDDTPALDRSEHDVIPLSIVYEILQRWDKSLATFESLGS